MRKRLWLGLGVLAAVALFFALDLQRFLSLAAVQGSLGSLREAYAEHGPLMVGGYFLCYVLMAALSLPGATVLTLGGAAVFGFWTTLVLVSFASTIGATLACALSRTLFRETVTKRLGPRLAAVDAGLAREGAFYLFTLRLVPLFPFFVVNAVMGLTAVPLSTFYLVSQIGMLPGTAVYVNAGTRLGELTSLSGIVSPGLLVSFALLGVFPLAARRAVDAVRRKRAEKSAQPAPSGPNHP